MKKLPLVAAFAIALLLTSCREITNAVLDILPPFDVPYTTTLEAPFAAVSSTSYTRTPEIPMNIDLDAKIKENNPKYSINNLKSVKMSSLTMEYVSSQLGTKLDAIKNMQIYVKAPNMPEKLIATAYNNTNPNSIVFTTTDAEILEYFRTTQNSIIVEIQANYPSTDRIMMKMNSNFKIKVQL